MRIARRRPLLQAAPFGAVLALGLMAGLVVLVFTLAIMRLLRDGDTQLAPPPAAGAPLRMADAFGLGGLASVRSPGVASGASPVTASQVITYYGSPRTPSMGILGQHAPEDVADLLAQRARAFDAANGDTPVLPALHVVYAVAQPEETDGLYLQYLDDRSVRQFIDLARRRGFAVILDLQIGHSRPLDEVKKISAYLREPDVFVALDPEFALSGTTKPGEAIGSIDAADINEVQAYLAQLTADARIPRKMLIVHQFQAEMITDASAIERRADVDLVIDMDGYGPADIKEVKYQRYGVAPYATFGGIKIFLEHDLPLLTEEQIAALSPMPALVVYQ